MIKYILDTTQKIIAGQLPYQVFNKELTSKDFSVDEQSQVKTLVNALLNRYFRYFYSLTNNQPTKLTTSEILALALYSYNLEKPLIKLSYEDLLSTLSANSQVKLESQYPASIFPIKIPASFQVEQPLLALATRFSVPLYLIEQLNEDIGKKNILRFLTSFPKESSGLLNPNVAQSDDFFAENPDFTPGNKPNQFTYVGNDHIKKTAPFNANQVVVTSQSMLDITMVVADLKPASVLFVQYDDTSLLLLLALSYPDLSIHYLAEDPKSRFILQHLIKKFNLKNVTYVNSIVQTYDLVLATLAGSNVNGRLRHRDFYFRLDPNLDVYKDKAREQLLGLKDYVNEKGHLLFVTLTPLRNETHYQALNFINDNPDFILVKEKQFFHFNPFYETAYFGLFAKVTNE